MNHLSPDVVFCRVFCVAAFSALAIPSHPFGFAPLVAGIFGACAGLCAILLEIRLRRAPLNAVLGGFVGALAGGLSGLALAWILNWAFRPGPASQFWGLILPLAGGYVGMFVGIAKSQVVDLSAIGSIAGGRASGGLVKILDTSVIIDGRILEIAESGFLDGSLIIPQFVLHELQLVADSSDSAKRNRGRRGLDIVQRLQKMPGIDLEISDLDFPARREVDLKLIEFAKLRRAKIVTNDFNLNKLARVQGVEVLNVNELANALKPVVLPGEAMRVSILKEGKEYNQGVAYLDDGTMIVVDNARRLISKTVDITVTSVLQTTAGKMIFGKYGDHQQSTGEHRPAAASASATV